MIMKNIHLDILLFLLLAAMAYHPLSAQVKYETEAQIEKGEVPQRARQFIARIQPTKSESWYREQNQDGVAIEVKLKKWGDRYSIKFSENGELQDVEKEIKWKEIPRDVREEMEEVWSESYDRHRVEKIQLHFEDDDERLLDYLQSGDLEELGNDYTYEIEVRVKKESEYGLYEFVFDDDGEEKQRRLIVTRRTDNMEF